MGKRRWIKVVGPMAGALGVALALAGCGRVSARIDSGSPTDAGVPVRVEAGKTVPLSVTFTNTGNRTGQFHVRAVVRDSAGLPLVIPPKTVTVEPGKQATVNWDWTVPAAGTYTVQFAVGKDAQSTWDTFPKTAAAAVVGLPPVVSTKFRVGDRVKVAQAVNVRTAPGVENPKVSHVNYRDVAPVGLQGKVVGGPEKAGAYVWWRVEFEAGYTGWCIEDALAKREG